LVSETDHSAKTSTYLLDQAGNPYQTTNRLDEISKYTYDNANRLTRIDYLKDSTAETFGYDAAGNKASSANNLVGYSFIYDRLNRLTQKLDSRNAQLSFTYDKVGNLLTKTTYQNTTTSYLYNAANRLVSLTNLDYLQADYQLDPAGRVLSRVSNSGARTLYQYDANGWVTKLMQYDAANNLVSDTSYTRDRVGNILTQSNASTGSAQAGTTTFTYDALYRLKTADYPAIGTASITANDEAYTYDKVGNRTTHTKGSITLGAAGSTTRYYNYTAGTNRLLDIRLGSATGTVESSFSNDFEGRLTAQTGSGTKTLTWDAKSRLKTLTQASITQTYGYDPMDYRIRHSNTANGQLDYYLEGEHLESVEQNGQLTEKYFRGASTDELIAAYLKDTDGKTKPYQFHHDNLTSTTQVTGHNGGTLQALSYSAFGSTLNQTGASPNRLKYTGREDDGTGLYYYRARYYDTDTGRFISEDPLGFGAGINFYAYVGNNPVNANDPSGMCPECVTAIYGAISGGVGGYVTSKLANQNFPDTLKSIGLGIVAGGGVGFFNPFASNQAGAAAAAAGVARSVGTVGASAVMGGATSAVGQFAGNVVAQQPLGTNFSYGAVLGSSVGNTFSIIPAKLSGNLAGSLVGTSVPFGSRSLPIMTPAVQNTIGTTRAVTEGLIGGVYEAGGQAIESTYFPSLPNINYGGLMANNPSMSFQQLSSPQFAAGGYLLYPNKTNNNQMQSVYSK
ncbi:MAG: RHS repeat-associated core domain-containing protein, partial [Methylococcales bacterium]|nr:RHS repeat-associated core domain-containing protein [Methylococcales bacterium]